MVARPTDILRVILIDAGLVDYPGQEQDIHVPKPQCTISSMPADPDVVLTLADTAGMMGGRIMETGETVQHFGIKLNMRHTDDSLCYDSIKAVFDAIDAWRGPKYVNARGMVCLVHNLYNNSSIISLGEEKDTRRYLYSLNVRMVMAQTGQTPVEQ